MNILAIVLSILSLAILFCIVFKPKIGALLYLVYMYMAPYLYIGGFIIYARTTAVIFFLLFLLKFKKRTSIKEYRLFIPYLLFLIFQFFLLFTSSAFLNSLNIWFTNCSSLFFILFLYANTISSEKNAILYSKVLLCIISVMVVYGLFLTLMPGFNPYQISLQPLFGKEFNMAYAAGNSGVSTNTELSDSRIFGRISSIFDHPMIYGLNLGFAFIYVLYIFKNSHKYLIISLLCIFSAILTSGIRTPIAALGITCILMMIYLRKLKIVISGLLLGIFFVIILSFLFPKSLSFVLSIFDNQGDIGGSSLSMRIEQLEGCLQIVKNDMITGKGYGWTTLYNSIHGAHPKALYFESLIYDILVNTGIIGFIIWTVFIIGTYKYIISTNKDIFERTILLGLFFYFLIYTTITGNYFGMTYFFVFYVILIGRMSKDKNSFRCRNMKSY